MIAFYEMAERSESLIKATKQYHHSKNIFCTDSKNARSSKKVETIEMGAMAIKKGFFHAHNVF